MWTNSYTLEQLGEFIAEARRARGYTQAQFAQLLRVSHTTLSNLERGKSVASETLQRAIQLLDMRMVVAPKSANVQVHENSDESQEAQLW